MATKPVITPFIWATDVNYTTGPAPLIGTPTKLTTPAATIDEGWKADETPPAQWFNFNFNHVTQFTNWVAFGSSAGAADAHIVEADSAGKTAVVELTAGGNEQSLSSVGWFGDGNDTDITLPGGTTTLTRDMEYNNLTVPAGSTLNTNGFRVFVKETLSLRGTITHSGTDGLSGGAGGAGGLGGIDGSLGRGGIKGGDGRLNADGQNAGDVPPDGVGVLGGVGGDANANTGGTAGTVNLPAATVGTHRTIHAAHGWFMGGIPDTTPPSGKIGGSTGGGGGAGDNVFGGGGGGPGGVMSIWAKVFDSDGTLECNGGNGGAADSGPGTAGGGGGGGSGGLIFLVTRQIGPLGSGTIQALAGTGGAADGTGTAGTAGSAGVIIQLNV